MIAAALALAYYGFRYADSMSRPIKALFEEYSRQEAEKLIADLEARIDEAAVALLQRVAAERRDMLLPSPCDVERGVAIESFVVLGPDKKLQCHGPAPTSKAMKAAWAAHLRNLNWDPVRVGSYHHYHELTDQGSTLVVYAARRDDDEQRYYVAATIDTSLIARNWLDEALAKFRKNLRVSVVDDETGLVAGPAMGGSEERFLYEGPLGKALYRWRVRIAPQNAELFRVEAERRKVLGPLLIILSTVIMMVGLGIVWLAVRTERRASHMKSDFIANVSHELKTPLSLIRMFGEMVATGRHKGEDAAREYGAIITRESERLSHLIDNVLDFARLERGKASYDFAEGNLADVVERALDVCRYRLEKEKLQLRTRIDLNLPPVRMDDNAMTLVMLNLVDNAIKYAADGGEVEVSAARIPGGVVLGVRDFGPGIAPDEQQRIFDRFYRARTARDRNVRGSGIGLSLVKHIADAHGGRVTVESPVRADDGRIGPGALFRVFLPAPVSDEGAESGARHDVHALGTVAK